MSFSDARENGWSSSCYTTQSLGLSFPMCKKQLFGPYRLFLHFSLEAENFSRLKKAYKFKKSIKMKKIKHMPPENKTLSLAKRQGSEAFLLRHSLEPGAGRSPRSPPILVTRAVGKEKYRRAVA